MLLLTALANPTMSSSGRPRNQWVPTNVYNAYPCFVTHAPKNVFLTHVNRTEWAQNRNRSDFARRHDVRQTDVALPDQLSPVHTGSVSIFACGAAGGSFDGDGTGWMDPRDVRQTLSVRSGPGLLEGTLSKKVTHVSQNANSVSVHTMQLSTFTWF